MNNDNDSTGLSSEAGDGAVTPESGLLYGSAVRLAIAEDIVRDICNMIPVIVISGEKGEGKSTLCRMAVEDIPSDWLTIVFDRTVESFEDVVREIARTIGCGDVDVSRSGMNSSIELVGERLQEIGKQVVTVFDGAEMIYLATLERIRKMLDQLNIEGVKMQVILCGRLLLLENLKQLSIVSFREVPEKRYFVKPLSVEDTGTYIDFLVHNPVSGVSGSYLPAAIQQIHSITGGNISKVYDCVVRISSSEAPDAALAEMAARTTQKKRSFDVVAALQKSARQFQRTFQPIVGRVKNLSRRDQLIGGGFCVALLVLLLLLSGGDKQEDKSVGEVGNETVEQGTVPVEEVTVTSEPEKKDDSAPVKTENEVAEEHQEQTPDVANSEIVQTPEETEATKPPEIQEQQAGSVEETPDTVPVEPRPEVVAQPLSPAESSVEKSVVQLEQATDDPAAEAETVKIEEPEASVETAPDIAETEPVVEPLPEPVENSSAISAAEEEAANQVTGGEAPLIASVMYKQVIADPVQTSEVTDSTDAESNIVISTLAESEKREIEVITSTPYKLIKNIEPLSESPAVESGEVEEVTPEPAFETPVEEVLGGVDGVDIQQEKTVEEKIKKPVLSQAIVVEGETPSTAVADTEISAVPESVGDTILDNRMEAGYPWLAGRRNGSYTMQLMMLSSDDAEAKIKGILSQREYKRASDNFYIFRKNSSPPVYFVFYGEYGNVTDARKARNEIPVFLRNHRPYVLSVPGAMRKVKL